MNPSKTKIRMSFFKKTIALVFLTAVMGLFQNCSPFDASPGQVLSGLDQDSYDSLEAKVESVFSNRCVGCHSSLSPSSAQPSLNLLYEMKFNQVYVKTKDPQNSLVYTTVLENPTHYGEASLDQVAPQEVQDIYNWIMNLH